MSNRNRSHVGNFLPEFTLKGPNVFRLLIPLSIAGFNERDTSFKVRVRSSDTVPTSSVAGHRGSDSSWKLQAGRIAAGDGYFQNHQTCFSLHFLTSRTDLKLRVQCRLSVLDPNGVVLHDYPINNEPENYQHTPETTTFRSITIEEAAQNRWLFDGALHVCAVVLFDLQHAALTPPGDGGYLRFRSMIPHEPGDPESDDFFLVGADGERIKTYKPILAEASPVFRAMFETDCQESRNAICHIEDAVAEGIKAMWNCILGADVEEMDADLVEKVFQLADKYELEKLKEMCAFKLASELTMENVANILLLAELHCAPLLKNDALVFLENNVDEAIMSGAAVRLVELEKDSGQPLYEIWQNHMRFRKTGRLVNQGNQLLPVSVPRGMEVVIESSS